MQNIRENQLLVLLFVIDAEFDALQRFRIGAPLQLHLCDRYSSPAACPTERRALQDLVADVSARAGIEESSDFGAYCGSGVTAAHTAPTLRLFADLISPLPNDFASTPNELEDVIDDLFSAEAAQSALHAAGRRKTASVFAVHGFYVYRGDT